MQVSKFLVMSALVGFAALALGSVKARAQEPQPVVPRHSNYTAMPLDPDLKAILAFRSDEVSAAQCDLIPVLLDVEQTGKKPMPSTVTVHCGLAQLIYGNQQGHDIKVPPMHTCFYVSLASYAIQNGGPIQCSLWVTTDNPDDYLSPVSNLRITGTLAAITILDAPKTIAADGVATAKIKARIADYNGSPLPNVPCYVRWNTPDTTTMFDEVGTASDENGIVSFTIPASKRAGTGYVEILAQTGGSSQVQMQYVSASTK